MKRLLILIVLSVTLLLSCTKPLDNIVILNVKEKGVDIVDNSLYTTTVYAIETTRGITNSTANTVTDDKDRPQVTSVIIDGERILIINKSSKTIHLSEKCSYVVKISADNKVLSAYDELYSYLQSGYKICSYCEKHY